MKRQTPVGRRVWLEEADALIAEATISSTRVGCELATVQARPYRDHDDIGREVTELVGALTGANG